MMNISERISEIEKRHLSCHCDDCKDIRELIKYIGLYRKALKGYCKFPDKLVNKLNDDGGQ